MTGRTVYAAGLTLTLLTGLTGCGDGGSQAKESDKGGKAAAEDKSPGSEGGSPKKPKDHGKPASPPKSPAALPKAADGTDTGACTDGDCEVELSKGDKLRPEPSYGVAEFTVESIKGQVVSWTALSAGSGVSISSGGGSESSTSCTNGSCTGRLGKNKGSIAMNELTIEFTSIGEDSAVAKVSHRK